MAERFVTLPPLMAATTMIMALSACESEDEKMADLLVGSWACQAQSPATADMPAMSVKADVQYMPHKKGSAQMVVSGVFDGIPIDLEMMGNSTWQIDDGNLIEDIVNLTIMNIRANGTSYMLAELPTEGQQSFETLRQAYLNSSSMTEIRDLIKSRLEIYDPITRLEMTCRAL